MKKENFTFSCIRNPIDRTYSYYEKYKNSYFDYLLEKKRRKGIISDTVLKITDTIKLSKTGAMEKIVLCTGDVKMQSIWFNALRDEPGLKVLKEGMPILLDIYQKAGKSRAPSAQDVTLPADESESGEKVCFFCPFLQGINKNKGFQELKKYGIRFFLK